MNEIEVLETIRRNLKTEHMAKDMWDGTTAKERHAYIEQFDAMTKAIAALREQAERERGCDACDLIYKLDGASYGTEDEMIDNRFCPMCGKRLEVEE